MRRTGGEEVSKMSRAIQMGSSQADRTELLERIAKAFAESDCEDEYGECTLCQQFEDHAPDCLWIQARQLCGMSVEGMVR